MGGDKRALHRLSMDLICRVMVADKDGNDVIVELEAVNISGRGVFCKTDRPLPVDTPVVINMVFSLDDFENMEGKRAEFNASGRVLRVSDEGMAISFDDEFEFCPAEEKEKIR
ncbi:MAG: PilZ domain-containing protein [Thermodesulfobacteriota bacterium]|nr:PilZ domain-containing protein [Thermodesulfobacteriota bacterium]